MTQYPNFYETIDEARMRLYGTMVAHSGEAYNVVWIGKEHTDGIFRMYLKKVLNGGAILPNIDTVRYNQGEQLVGPFLDGWVSENPDGPIVVKPINCPGFNKFRPFPLGMVNYGPKVYYVERQPLRKTEQGLIQTAIDAKRVSIGREGEGDKYNSKRQVDIWTDDFARTVRGEYPTAEECLVNLLDNEIVNQGAAFDRKFALIRGPVGIICLAYKTGIVGVLPQGGLESVVVSRDYRHLKEVLEELHLFYNITFQR